jgi:hypothetical protein
MTYGNGMLLLRGMAAVALDVTVAVEKVDLLSLAIEELG